MYGIQVNDIFFFLNVCLIYSLILAGFVLCSSSRMEDIPAADTFSVEDMIAVRLCACVSLCVWMGVCACLIFLVNGVVVNLVTFIDEFVYFEVFYFAFFSVF